MKIHRLKTKEIYFRECAYGSKTFELRKNDRNFQIGDTVILQEINASKQYTGKEIMGIITYVLKDCEQYGLSPDYVIFSFKKFN